MVISASGSIGTRLREARVARGVGLDEAFEHTRINKRFLEALERDAPPGEFPAPVYARAFLEEYARYLGLDPAPLLTDYRRLHGEPEPQPLRLPVPVEEPRGPWGRVLLTVASTLALVAITVFAVRAGRDDQPVTPVTPAVPPVATTPAPPPAEPTPTEPPVVQGVRLHVRVIDAPAWIRVMRAEEILFEGTVDPGYSETFRSGRRGLVFRTGNAGAVRLVVNGERMEIDAATGGIYEASFSTKEGRVVVEESA